MRNFMYFISKLFLYKKGQDNGEKRRCLALGDYYENER